MREGGREQKSAGRKLLHAFDGRSAETDDEGDTPSGFAAWRSFSFSSFSPRARKDTSTSIETTTTASEDDDKAESGGGRSFKEEAGTGRARRAVEEEGPKRMWRKSERCGAKVLRRSFNTATAQKKALEKEKRDLENEARNASPKNGEGRRRKGACAASRRLEAPSRRRRDSWPSHDDVGGFFFEFEPFGPRRNAPRFEKERRLSFRRWRGRGDGGEGGRRGQGGGLSRPTTTTRAKARRRRSSM